jgi:hypothetical protein
VATALGADCQVECRPSVDKARKVLAGGFVPNLVIIDHALGGKENGLAFFKHLVDTKASCHVLILSSVLMRTDVPKQEVWKSYRSLMAEADAAGAPIRVDIREKGHTHPHVPRTQVRFSDLSGRP